MSKIKTTSKPEWEYMDTDDLYPTDWKVDYTKERARAHFMKKQRNDQRRCQ